MEGGQAEETCKGGGGEEGEGTEAGGVGGMGREVEGAFASPFSPPLTLFLPFRRSSLTNLRTYRLSLPPASTAPASHDALSRPGSGGRRPSSWCVKPSRATGRRSGGEQCRFGRSKRKLEWR